MRTILYTLFSLEEFCIFEFFAQNIFEFIEPFDIIAFNKKKIINYPIKSKCIQMKQIDISNQNMTIISSHLMTIFTGSTSQQ